MSKYHYYLAFGHNQTRNYQYSVKTLTLCGHYKEKERESKNTTLNSLPCKTFDQNFEAEDCLQTRNRFINCNGCKKLVAKQIGGMRIDV